MLLVHMTIKEGDDLMRFIMKLKRFSIDLIETMKRTIKTIPYSIMLIIVLYLLQNELFVLLVTFIIGNLGIDHIMSRDAMTEKIRNKKIYKENFDEEYFDLYHECKQMHFALLYNFQLVSLSCVQWHMSGREAYWYEYIAFQVGACSIAIILWSLYLTHSNKEKNLNALLFERKKEWGRPYSEKEQELLNIIADMES